MSEERIPIVEEEAHIFKRAVETERVRVRTRTDEEQVVLQESLRRQQLSVTRVPIDREVSEAPLVRTEGEFTIVPVLEERVFVQTRLFLVEELHIRRSVEVEPVELQATVRRMRVEVEREDLTDAKDS